MMDIVISDTYSELSQKAAADSVRFMELRKDPLLCTASGDTPAGLYQEIVAKVSKKEIDISRWTFVGLDEWAGMNGADEGSCRFHLNNQLFHPLKITGDKICFFDGKAGNPDKECELIENFIRQYGHIDVAILGLGMNGHVGMNEPGTFAGSRSHITAIDPITQKTGQKYFKEQRQLSAGLTLGLGTIMESTNIVLLVSGSHKAEIVKKVLKDDISDQLPASLLRKHPRVTIYLDREAAKLIR